MTGLPEQRILRVRRDELLDAADDVGIGRGRGEALWQRLEETAARQPRFDAVHVLYYVGALVVILGMVFLAVSQWDALSGLGIVALAGAYAAVFLAAGHVIWHRHPDLRTPAGLLVTMAVALTPVLVYGVQREFGIWPFDDPGTYRDFPRWVRSGWFAMEVGTLATTALALAVYRFPFLTAPAAVILWYMSMDLTLILFDSETAGWYERRLVSLLFGLAVVGVAYAVDRLTRRDFAFWLYLAGVAAFWGGLSLMDADTEFGRFLYCLINLGLIALSVYLRRRAFLVFGALGVSFYVGDLSRRLFPDDILYTVAVSAIGMAVLATGVWLARNRGRVDAWVDATLPAALQRLRPDPR